MKVEEKKKAGKGLGAFIMWIMSGGCMIDMGVGTQLQIAH